MSSSGVNHFLQANQDGNLAAVKHWCHHKKASEEHNTLLQQGFEIACRYNNLEVVKFYGAACRALINLNPIFSYKYIFWYCQPLYQELMKLLVSWNTLEYYELLHNRELVYTIVSRSDAATLSQLLSIVPQEWRFYLVDTFAISMAAENGDSSVVQVLLESKSSTCNIHENKAGVLFNALHSQNLDTITCVCSPTYTQNQDLFLMSTTDIIDILQELFCARRHDILQFLHQTFDNTCNTDDFLWNELTFITACEHGDTEFLMWLLHCKPSIELSYLQEKGFRDACSGGHLKLAQWFFMANPDTDAAAENDDAFARACHNGHLSVAKWLWELSQGMIDVGQDDDLIFRKCLSNACPPMLTHAACCEVLHWLLTIRPSVNLSTYGLDGFEAVVRTENITLLQWYLRGHPSFDISLYNHRPFTIVCYQGKTSLLQAFVEQIPEYDVTVSNNVAFANAVSSGSLEVCQWILQRIQSQAAVAHPLILNDTYFNTCCTEGHRHILEWLWSLTGVPLQDSRRVGLVTFDMFREACASGDLDFVCWCYDRRVDSLDLSKHNDILFRDAAQLNLLSIMKFLLQRKPDIDITANNHEAFKAACLPDRSPGPALWLQSLHRDYHVRVEEYWEGEHQRVRVASFSIHRQLVIEGEVLLNVGSGQQACPICYTSAVDLLTDCGHYFCTACLEKTLRITENKGCPLCRTDFKTCKSIHWCSSSSSSSSLSVSVSL